MTTDARLAPGRAPTARELLARWRHSPPRFARDALGLATWSRQRALLDAVVRHPRVACRSGHKVGKSYAIAILALWWFCTRAHAQVILSSATSAQLENILWPALREVYDHAKVPLGGLLSPDYHRGLRMGDGRHVFGLKPEDSNPEAFAGVPGDLLILIDEASGFPRALLDAALGSVAAGGTSLDGRILRECRIVLTGNPTRTSGCFYDCFHDDSALWETLHIDSRESPNITGAEPPVPGLATREWLAEILTHCRGDESHPTYQVRVAGQFPGTGTNTVIQLGVVEKAAARWSTTPADGPLAIGVDVGRFGDDPSVIYPRRGKRALPPEDVRKADGTAVAVAVLKCARRLRTTGEKPRVKVDVIGVGASVYDALRLQVLVYEGVTYHPSAEVDAIAVDVAMKAHDEEQYANRRAECWFALLAWLSDGGSIPPDATTAGELVAPTYSFDGQGRYLIEPKDKIKARLGRSPDYAEALMLSVVDEKKFLSTFLAAMQKSKEQRRGK